MRVADRSIRALPALLMGAAAATSIGAANPPADRPVAVPASRVVIDDAFWSPKLATWRKVTVPDCLDKFERDGAFRNFDHIAQGRLDAPHGGPQWYDGLVYELIRGAADLMAQHAEPAQKRFDGVIERIAAAAARDPDGYVNTYTQMREPNHRWGQHGGNDREQHDLYNVGCLVEAGIHYQQATGKTKLLATAVRAANGMVPLMGPPPGGTSSPATRWVRSRSSAYMSCSEISLNSRTGWTCRSTSEPTSNWPVSGSMPGATMRAGGASPNTGRTTSRCSSRRPSRGTPWRLASCRRRRGIRRRRGTARLRRGGRSPLAKHGHPPPLHYRRRGCHRARREVRWRLRAAQRRLPGDCAAVGCGFLDQNLFLATGDAAKVDELESSLYNGALAGVSLAGNSYFYENPLQAGRTRSRWSWHACPCCPPMFLKLMGALPVTSTRPMPVGYTSTYSSARGRRSTSAGTGDRSGWSRRQLTRGRAASGWPSTPSGQRPLMSASESPRGASVDRPMAVSTRPRRPVLTASPSRSTARPSRRRRSNAATRSFGASGGRGHHSDWYVHAGAAGGCR